jgi:3',5'-cyclic-nucleotide phosphodiesterase
VSRRHARITRRGERFVVEDLHSTNGTLLRNEFMSPGIPNELGEGDEIRIGPTHLIFHLYRPIRSMINLPSRASRAS